MSSFLSIQQEINRYRDFEFHRNEGLANKLIEVQIWQKNRMEQLHQALFSIKEHQEIKTYFLNELYGGPNFSVLATQFERMLEKLAKIEKYAPDSVIETGVLGAKVASLAIELDQALANYLLHHAPKEALSPELMFKAYQETNQKEPRLLLMMLLQDLGTRLDKYVRSFVIYTAFKMAKSKAIKHEFEPLYNFLGAGFTAMKPLDSAERFLTSFIAKEQDSILAVYDDFKNPF